MKYSLWERRTYFVRAYRSSVRPEIFLNQRASDNVDALISELKVSDPGSLPIDAKFEAWYDKELKREYEKLRRDWSRRLGSTGWLRDLVDTTDAMDIISDHMLELDQIRMKMRSIYEDSAKKPGQRIAATFPAMSAMKMQRELVGIQPMVQPEILTAEKIEELKERMDGSEFFQLLKTLYPNGYQQVIDEIFRSDEFMKSQLDLNEYR